MVDFLQTASYRMTIKVIGDTYLGCHHYFFLDACRSRRYETMRYSRLLVAIGAAI